jgi:hypothetical protein
VPKLASLSEVKRQHETLYEEALRDRHALIDNADQQRRFIGEVDALLDDVVLFSKQVKTVDDYAWLTDAVLKWQVLFSAVLNLPRSVEFLSPPESIEPSAGRPFWSEEELDRWFRDSAYQQSLIRKTNFILRETGLLLRMIPSSGYEMDQDWFTTNTLLAARVLENKINLGRQLESRSYCRLEREWLSSVEKLKAYFVWERREVPPGPGFETVDYYAACEEIRRSLVEPDAKASLEDFEDVREYLEASYLTKGKFDVHKGDSARRLQEEKANRISTIVGGHDPDQHWFEAETYLRLYYENIIPAVIGDSKSSVESTLMVLKAFQFSKSAEKQFLIINAFEAAVAVCFLDAKIIEELWAAAADKPVPERYTVSTAPLRTSPGAVAVPQELAHRLRVDADRRQLVFLGVMAKSDRNLLWELLPGERQTINELFEQSRLLPRDSTL